MAEYKRKIYLINPKFQLRFSFYVCMVVCVVSIIYPITIYELMTDLILKFADLTPEFSQKLAEKRGALLTVLILWQLGMTALVFIACIIFSHKIAGPIYKCQKYFSELRDRSNNGELYFRKGDYFQELASDINLTFDDMREKYRNDLVYLSEVSAYIKNLSLVVPDDKKIILSEIEDKLGEIQNRFQNS